MAQSSASPGGLNVAEELAFYIDHLKTVILPFWLNRCEDVELGGYVNCFDNEGRRLLSMDKFTWSQGRFVWVWSKLASMRIFRAAEQLRFAALARSGAEFLMAHCLLPNGNCAFLMSRDGTPKPAAPGLPLDSSIYADCFAVSGLARYAGLSGEQRYYDFARSLYRTVAGRIEAGDITSEPYPVPPGYKPHGIPMIMLDVSQVLAGAAETLGMAAEAAALRQAADGYLRRTLGFVDAGKALHEFMTVRDEFDRVSLLGRHTNPGHIIEDAWFMLQQARRSSDAALVEHTTATVAHIVEHAFAIGWDDEFGGLLHFADQDGGKPKGSLAGFEDVRVVRQVVDGWGDKLWWVHSEALYSTLLAYYATGDAGFLGRYRQARDYTFSTFPNPDPAVGEWIQIRDRQGRPVQKVVALPVKDPYHIIRNLALIIDLLQEHSA